MVAAKYVLHLIIGCHPILSPHGCCATKGKISRFATPQTPQAASVVSVTLSTTLGSI
jgi:hypothetical protein